MCSYKGGIVSPAPTVATRNCKEQPCRFDTRKIEGDTRKHVF